MTKKLHSGKYKQENTIYFNFHSFSDHQRLQDIFLVQNPACLVYPGVAKISRLAANSLFPLSNCS